MEVHEGGRQNNQMPEIPKGLISKIITGIIVVIVLLVGFTSFYTLEEQERAMILTFGEYTGEEAEAGLKFKWPYPIQQVTKYPANLTQEMQIGFRMTGNDLQIVEDEALMITGDENLVHADAVVEWNVSNMQQFFFNIDDPEEFIRNAATAAIRSVIGNNQLDFAITDGKTVIQAETMEVLLEMMEIYESGIHIIDLKFQDIEPPEGEVQQAFREVTNAREEKNTKINQANRYVNQRLPLARGEARALIENAEAAKQSRILNAEGDVANFQALYNAYVNNPEVTQSRLILETLEQVMPGAKVIITNGDSDTVNYLPLNEIMQSSTPSRSTQPPSTQSSPMPSISQGNSDSTESGGSNNAEGSNSDSGESSTPANNQQGRTSQ